MNVLGIDIGGTKIALKKYETASWKPLGEAQIPTPSGNQESFLNELTELIEDHIDDDTQVIGIGVPGPTVKGYVSKLPNIPNVHDLCLSKEMAQRLELQTKQIVINNDANCFIVGAWQKEHQELHNILGLTLGTGVGGGLIINDQLIIGKDGVAGEFGHMIVRDGKTLQELASGKALAQRWHEDHYEAKIGQEIVKMAENADEKAVKFLKKVGKDLGTALGSIIMGINPDIILIGGSAAAALPYMEATIKEVMAQFRYPKAAEIELIQLSGTDYATFGAAWLATKAA